MKMLRNIILCFAVMGVTAPARANNLGKWLGSAAFSTGIMLAYNLYTSTFSCPVQLIDPASIGQEEPEVIKSLSWKELDKLAEETNDADLKTFVEDVKKGYYADKVFDMNFNYEDKTGCLFVKKMTWKLGMLNFGMAHKQHEIIVCEMFNEYFKPAEFVNGNQLKGILKANSSVATNQPKNNKKVHFQISE